MLPWAIAIIITVVIFFVLQPLDEKRLREKNEPPATMGRKVATFFFIAMIVFALTFWFSSNQQKKYSIQTTSGGTDIPKNEIVHPHQKHVAYHPPINDETMQAIHKNMIRNIREEVSYGGAPF